MTHPKFAFRNLPSEVFLLLYHLAFAVIFTWYLNTYGGDAIRYWNLTAETGHHPQSWMDHWGTRSFFIQWLNYFPAKILGLPFWLGNLCYALVSFWAIREVWRMVMAYFPGVSNTLNHWVLLLLFLSPNLHFWTSGIGKESLGFLGLVMFMKGSLDLRKNWYWILFGVGLSYMVRPLQGGILLAFVLPLFWWEKEFPSWLKWGVSLIILVLGLLALRFLLYITHIDTLNFQGIAQFSEEQMTFLEGFAAGSQVPMSEYSWMMKLWTLFFRPFVGEAAGFWQWASALENLVALVLLFLFLFDINRFRFRSVPGFVWIGIAFGMILMFVYALTLNNLGIIMRMKSVYMLFFYLLWVWKGSGEGECRIKSVSM
ncbi:hypothetical protein [Shivajiella indica]|uniref:DUF2029 domain-containing protein n=1 Tax=Shivajiella indica TaxID=872115 RepID=A0ABW5BAB1_9BACT